MNEYLTVAERQTLKTKRVVTWSVVILLIVGSVLGIYQLSKSSQKKTIDPAVLAEDQKTGPDDAKVKLIEYADFQCPACKAAEPMVKQLQNDFGDRIQIIYRYFPLKNIHPNAVVAAEAAEAAGKQGQFWQMHDLLFDNQEAWASSANAADYFIQYARSLGLDEDQFTRDLRSEAVSDKINASYDRALDLGLNGTPTFFLNGSQIATPNTYDQFKQMIQDELDKA
jgi:protein-disulfide isomerase